MAGKFGIESDGLTGVRLIVAADTLCPACEDEDEIDWQVANLMADLEATANEMKAALKALAKLPVDG